MAPGLGDMFRRLLGGAGGQDGGAPQADSPIEYHGYTIVAAPRHEGGHWLVAGTIRKVGEGEPRSYDFIRADSYTTRESAAEFTVVKAKQMIDLEGDRIFEKTRG